MADIFVSYSRLDHDRVKAIVDRLESLGYSVSWDRQLRADAFADEIETQIDRAKAVLAVWSDNAVNSTWVYAEAARAADAGKLAQVRLDEIDCPPPFNAIEAADMSGGRSAWGPLEDALSRIIRGGASPASLPRLGLLATPAAAGGAKLVTFATGAALAAYASATAAAYNAVMSTSQLQVAAMGVLGVGAACAALSGYRLFAVTRAGG